MEKRRETKTVLIIEDDAGLRNFAARVLELEGYRVFQTEDGDEGLRLVGEIQVALVLLDLRMPGRDGWSVLSRMKSEPALLAIPVVVFTASVAVSREKRARSMGAADYLVKPVSAASLKETVAHILYDRR